MPTMDFIRGAQADNAGDVMLCLMTITHPDLPEPERLVRDFKDLVSRGMTFRAVPFTFIKPGSGEDGPSRAKVAIDNVDQRMVQLVRSLSTPPTLVLEIVLESDPDTVQQEFPLFRLMQVSGDRSVIEAELVDVDDDAEPLTADTFTPSTAPALF